jgi:hypothetical protein
VRSEGIPLQKLLRVPPFLKGVRGIPVAAIFEPPVSPLRRGNLSTFELNTEVRSE